MTRRYCKVFYCPTVGDRLCCSTCRLRKDCGAYCLNHPSRCRLEDTTRRSNRYDPPEKSAP